MSCNKDSFGCVWVELKDALLRLRANDNTLTHLNLKRRSIGDEEARTLAEALKENTALANLDLTYNEIGAEGARALAEALKENTALTNLNLGSNEIGDEGAHALAEALEKNIALTHLGLGSNKVGAEGAHALAKCLKENTALANLNLGSNKIGAKGARALAEALKENTALANLGLGSNEIGAEEACALAGGLKENTALTQLDLDYNKIGVEGAFALAAALKENTALANLNLGSNKIGAKGARALAEALEKNTALTNLKLGSNKIGADGARAFARSLKKNTALTQLDLDYNKIGAGGARALAKGLKKNTALTHLDLGSNKIGAKGALELAEALKKNVALTNLQLAGNKIGADGARALAESLKENAALTQLNLDCNEIGAEGALSLAEALKENTAFTKMNMDCNDIGDEGARALAEALKENTALTNLQLANNEIGAGGARALAKGFKKNTALTHLDLLGNEIGAEGARALAKALMKNTALTHLDLWSNEIGDEGAHALAKCLKENTALTELDLGENKFSDEGACALAEVLKENTALTQLNLRKNKIGAEGACALAEGLKENTAITYLELGSNGIGDEGARAEGDVKELRRRNVLLQLQGNEVATRGFSFYFGKSGNCDMETNSLCIKETVWAAATTGDGLVLRLVQDVLQKYLAECGKGNVVKLEKESLKKMFDKSKNSEGSPLLHLAAALDSEEALEMCRFLVDEIGVDFDTATNHAGLTARDIAQGNARASKWAKSVGTFLGRYYLEEKGRYKSSTCIVHFAVDVEKSKGDPERNVAIKIMINPDQFERELNQRLRVYSWAESGVDIEKGRNRFHENHVVPLLRYHTERIKGEMCHCLVMPKGQRNLDEVIRYEGIAGSDVNAILFFAVDIARALLHFHSKPHSTIHGDFKPRNIVRINGNYKLIDFDASVIIGGDLTEKFSSGYLPPELARLIFRPEEKLENLNERINELKKKRQEASDQNDFDAVYEIMGELNKVKGKIKQIEDSSLATPKKNLAINVDMDVWSYGVVMYQMLTGRSLFNCDKNDNLLNDQEEQKLVSWKGITDDDLVHVLKDCKDQGLVDAAKDLLCRCLSNDKRPKSFNQVCDHPFLKRGNLPSQKPIEWQQEMLQSLIKGQHEIKEKIKDGNAKLIAKVDLMIDKLDMTHKMMSEMQTQLKDISKNVNDLLPSLDAPKLMYIIPADSSLKDWINLKALVGKEVKVIFICPVTFSVPRDGKNKPMGYAMTMPKGWVEKYGPALKISFEVLRVGFAVGRLAGLPLPNLQGIGKTTNPLHVLSDNLDVYMNDGGKETRTCADEIGGIINLTIPEPSKALNGLDRNKGSGLSDDIKKLIECSYNEVKKIAEENEDVGFLKTGLTKVVADGGVEYVLNDPKIKALYEEHGRECIGLTTTQLSDLGAELDVVVKEGELEKNSNKIIPQERHRKRDSFIRRQKESWKRYYFVLRKSGSLTYYRSKEERHEDPLGVRGNTKAKRVIQIEDHDKMGSFRVSYDDESNNQQIFKVPAISGQTSPSDRDVVNDWVEAWVDRAKAHLS